MILTSEEILAYHLIFPFDPSLLQPNSYDFRLGNQWATLQVKDNFLDLVEAEDTLEVEVMEKDEYILQPHSCVLAISLEKFRFPYNICGKVFSKSSLGRLFLTVSCGDAGFCDAGWRGKLVLELVNHSNFAIKLRAGQRIGQMVFLTSSGNGSIYEGSYQDQSDDFAVSNWKKALVKIGKGPMQLGMPSVFAG